MTTMLDGTGELIESREKNDETDGEERKRARGTEGREEEENEGGEVEDFSFSHIL